MQGRFPRRLWPVGLFCSPWPEQALRANIHCQISLALNRIYTEWYPSKGYTFNITNSTSYDQYYVHGRTVFDVMVRLTDDIFNTYIRKTGTVNPYYAEYCDGKSVTCPGLKQWGTVTLANQGRSALSILKYYYGSNIEIIRTNNIQSIPQSYPGSPLRQGSTGAAVFTLQRQLNRITKDYPFLGLLTVDGIFGRKMTETVKKFQKQFNLTADGVVGRQTWYKISYIYVSVKDLAELTSEGETSTGTLSNGTWNGTVLSTGASGSAVEQVQFWLNTLAQYDSAIPSVKVDGVFGTATANAVRAFQRKYGLTVDGIVGQTTWKELYDEFLSIQSDNGTPNAYPGTPLREGSSGQNVRLVQFWLKIARTVYTSLESVTVDGKFGAGTAAAVRRFQRYFGLTADGVVGRTTWQKLYEVYNDIANRLLSSSLRPGEYPGVLRTGSSGTAVRELQFYLYLMSAYESSIPVVSIDGSFGAATENAVRAYQRFAKLTVDGVVGRTTWNSLYSKASILRVSGPVVTLKRLPYPGTPLAVGATGNAVLYYNLLLQRIAYYFDSVESEIAHLAFSIPAVKGIEFGTGFGFAGLRGSEANDAFRMTAEGAVVTATNHNAGINGGIANGMPVVFRTAVKPTPSIYKQQDTVDYIAKKDAQLSIQGRHDPCIVPRAAIVQTCAAALAVGDLLTARYGARWMTDPTGYRKED